MSEPIRADADGFRPDRKQQAVMAAVRNQHSVIRAEFMASLPNIQSALRVGGDGMRAQLEIPESELHEALKLAAMKNRLLRVTVETVDEGE